MYNRYIPQSDGSYQKKRMQDPPCPPPSEKSCEPQQKTVISSPVAQAPQFSCTPVQPRPDKRRPTHQPPNPCPSQGKDTSPGGFLRNLLPANWDTGDLLIIVLLLLMAGDCQEDKNTMLLTIALYLFM